MVCFSLCFRLCGQTGTPLPFFTPLRNGQDRSLQTRVRRRPFGSCIVSCFFFCLRLRGQTETPLPFFTPLRNGQDRSLQTRVRRRPFGSCIVSCFFFCLRLRGQTETPLPFFTPLRNGQDRSLQTRGAPPAVISPYTSKFAYFAFFSMNSRRGSTCSPIRMLNASSARSASSMVICTITRLAGFMVVSHSWSGFISPRPL